MRALKLKVEIDGSGKLVVELPAGLKQGPAELILLTEEEERPVKAQGPSSQMSSLLDALLDSPHEGRPREELDGELQAERNSWS